MAMTKNCLKSQWPRIALQFHKLPHHHALAVAEGDHIEAGGEDRDVDGNPILTVLGGSPAGSSCHILVVIAYSEEVRRYGSRQALFHYEFFCDFAVDSYKRKCINSLG